MAAPQGTHAGDVPQAVVKNVDMDADMQQAIVEIAADAIVKFALEKDMAAFVKRTVDDQYGPTWHVIVGRSFGSYVTHGTLYGSCRIQALYLLLYAARLTQTSDRSRFWYGAPRAHARQSTAQARASLRRHGRGSCGDRPAGHRPDGAGSVGRHTVCSNRQATVFDKRV